MTKSPLVNLIRNNHHTLRVLEVDVFGELSHKHIADLVDALDHTLLTSVYFRYHQLPRYEPLERAIDRLKDK